jgi:outer membrane protein
MKMRRTVIILFALLFTVVLQAQDLKFGIFSYEAVLQSMPDYVAAQQDLSQLRSQYDAETKRTEDEFNVKYEAFLEEQSGLAPTFRNKRQLELQDMMERGITFKKEAKRLLEQAEKDALTPVKNRLSEAVKQLGRERGYAFILNADSEAVPYMSADKGEDVTEVLKALLMKK